MAEGNQSCVLCDGTLDTEIDQHNALQATQWSTIVSSRGKALGKNVDKIIFQWSCPCFVTYF